MRNSVKAALSSAVILPGSGLFILKHYLLGLCFFLPSCASLIYILQHYFTKALRVTEAFALGQLPPDLTVLVAEVLAESDPNIAGWLSTAKWVYVMSWLIGIPVSAIAGHLRDQKKSLPR